MSARVFIVDDDEAVRDSLKWLLGSRAIASVGYASAEDFLAAWRPELEGCVVLDIRMQAMSGPELFDRLRGDGCSMPVIFLTGHGDVPMAVAALKKGAFDFVEKPCQDNELVERVIAALKLDATRRAQIASSDSLRARLGELTTREQQVMERVLAGKANKVIADELQISMRTVEVHRSRLLEKMGVRTAVDLARAIAASSEGRQ